MTPRRQRAVTEEVVDTWGMVGFGREAGHAQIASPAVSPGKRGHGGHAQAGGDLERPHVPFMIRQ